MGMSPACVLDRRRFLRQALGQGSNAELSCERLYMRYLEAADAARLPEFLKALREEIGRADEVRLTKREWLEREDFRHALEAGLGVTLHGS